ncbi:unnamed protein product [Taenia asiatica]|uniref:Uncharacterized protein n=1 Tax=Taenia asiatica TaxID=60517 RepID=A0A3P6NQZ8_TAEAS|nr:unnamed protein product [Taenia asiatica]
MWTRAPVCLLELNSLLVFAGPADIVSDDAHVMLFDKLPDRPSGYCCSRLVDYWPSCPFSAIATDAASLARSFVHASEAYHCILFLYVLSAVPYPIPQWDVYISCSVNIRRYRFPPQRFRRLASVVLILALANFVNWWGMFVL